MKRNFRIAVLATLAATLASCGGSSSSTGAGSTRSVGAVSGSITGFGSVFVDGAEYDDTAATVSDDTDPANPVASTLDALAIGQSVDLSLDSAGRIPSPRHRRHPRWAHRRRLHRPQRCGLEQHGRE